jgi:hypothetical protein
VMVHIFVPENVMESRMALHHLEDQLTQMAVKMELEKIFIRGDVTFAVSNGEKYRTWLKPFGLQMGRLPAIGIADFRGHYHGIGEVREGTQKRYDVVYEGLQLSPEEEQAALETTSLREVGDDGMPGETVGLELPEGRVETFLTKFLASSIAWEGEEEVAEDAPSGPAGDAPNPPAPVVEEHEVVPQPEDGAEPEAANEDGE